MALSVTRALVFSACDFCSIDSRFAPKMLYVLGYMNIGQDNRKITFFFWGDSGTYNIADKAHSKLKRLLTPGLNESKLNLVQNMQI